MEIQRIYKKNTSFQCSHMSIQSNVKRFAKCVLEYSTIFFLGKSLQCTLKGSTTYTAEGTNVVATSAFIHSSYARYTNSKSWYCTFSLFLNLYFVCSRFFLGAASLWTLDYKSGCYPAWTSGLFVYMLVILWNRLFQDTGVTFVVVVSFDISCDYMVNKNMWYGEILRIRHRHIQWKNVTLNSIAYSGRFTLK